jgi:hypothetical protein
MSISVEPSPLLSPVSLLINPPPLAEGDESSSSPATTPLNHLNDNFGFMKTLQDEISSSIALDLLQDIQNQNDLLSNYTRDDLVLLSECMTLLNLEAGEKIITKGETATFCAIALRGSYSVIVSPELTVTLGPGSMIGEMSYFEKGIRTADIMTSSEGILAIISFEELEGLKETNYDLHNKFCFMLAVTSIRKLRSMTQPKFGVASNNSNNSNSTTNNSNNNNNNHNSGPSNSTPAASSTIDFSVKHRQETLFLSRLKRQAAEVQQKLAVEHSQREKQQKQLRNIEYNKANLDRKLLQLNKEIYHLNEQLNSSNKQLKQSKQLLISQTSLSNNLANQLHNAQNHANEQQNLLITTKNQWELYKIEQNQVKILLEEEKLAILQQFQQLQAEYSDLKTQNEGKISELSELRAQNQQIHSEKSQLITEQAEFNKNFTAVHNEFDYLSYRTNQLSSENKYLLNLNKELEQNVGEFKQKAEDYGQNYRKTVQQYTSLINDLSAEKQKSKNNQIMCEKVIKVLSIKQFVKNFRTRRLLFDIYHRISQLTAQTLQSLQHNYVENIAESSKPGASSSNSSWNTSGGAVLSEMFSRKTGPNWGKEKLNKYKELRQSRANIQRLVNCLDEEVNELREPIEFLYKNNRSQKLTIDSFFNRNIQLTQALLANKETIHQLKAKSLQLIEEKEEISQKLQQELQRSAIFLVNNPAIAKEIAAQHNKERPNTGSAGSKEIPSNSSNNGANNPSNLSSAIVATNLANSAGNHQSESNAVSRANKLQASMQASQQPSARVNSFLGSTASSQRRQSLSSTSNQDNFAANSSEITSTSGNYGNNGSISANNSRAVTPRSPVSGPKQFSQLQRGVHLPNSPGSYNLHGVYTGNHSSNSVLTYENESLALSQFGRQSIALKNRILSLTGSRPSTGYALVRPNYMNSEEKQYNSNEF